MSKFLLQRYLRLTPLFLMAVVLSVFGASSGHAHSGHIHKVNSVPAVGATVKQRPNASRQLPPDSVHASRHSSRQNPRVAARLPDRTRQVVWAISVRVSHCGTDCSDGCLNCDCNSCPGTCSTANACSAACASAHGAIASYETYAYGICGAVLYRLPIVHRTTGWRLSPEPPPPKS